MATHSSVLAWRIPQTEESGRLQSMGWQRVGYDWSDLACMHPSLPHRCEGVLCRPSIGAVTLSYIQNAHQDAQFSYIQNAHLQTSSVPGQNGSTPLAVPKTAEGHQRRDQTRWFPSESGTSSENGAKNWKSRSLNNSPPVTPRYNVSSSLQWMGQRQCLSNYSKQLCLPLAEIPSTYIFNMDKAHQTSSTGKFQMCFSKAVYCFKISCSSKDLPETMRLS